MGKWTEADAWPSEGRERSCQSARTGSTFVNDGGPAGRHSVQVSEAEKLPLAFNILNELPLAFTTIQNFGVSKIFIFFKDIN